MAHESQNAMQRELVRQARAESCIDAQIPLGFGHFGRPEIGPTIQQYYLNKHKVGQIGRFYPLHRVAVRHA